MVKKTSLGLFNRYVYLLHSHKPLLFFKYHDNIYYFYPSFYSPITHSLIKRSYKHTLPNLPYEYSALEPVISSELLNFHHQKHHQAYVNNLNAAQEKLNEAHSNNDLNSLLTISNTLKFNYGGHINHSIYWQNLSPNGGGKPNDPLMTAIKNCFGSFDTMVNLMTNAAVAVQGSGWAWLGYNSQNKSLQIATTGNQELLQSAAGTYNLYL